MLIKYYHIQAYIMIYYGILLCIITYYDISLYHHYVVLHVYV